MLEPLQLTAKPRTRQPIDPSRPIPVTTIFASELTYEWGITWRMTADTVPAPRGILSAGFRQLGQTIANLRAYPLTLLFLGAFLIYNDGIQTVIALASTYGSEQLQLGEATLAATILVVQFVAFGGALLLGAIATLIGARKTVLASLTAWAGLVLAAFWLPARAPVLFLALGAGIGLVLGGSQALSRSLFSQLIPSGREAEYFGFYAISDKGTSWLGPLLFGLVYQATTSCRLGIVSVLVFFIAGFVAPPRRPDTPGHHRRRQHPTPPAVTRPLHRARPEVPPGP
ncbi:MFS transporter [Arthrobacter sp. ISL-5]|uniref:MFS transporter n=1 Tax=Arthrobacter sp. ISL-5 TaxID=2819111 RepID=UPI0027E15DC9|nr:MFS transporter [Arthrobacter sp. ISL-5]